MMSSCEPIVCALKAPVQPCALLPPALPPNINGLAIHRDQHPVWKIYKGKFHVELKCVEEGCAQNQHSTHFHWVNYSLRGVQYFPDET